MPLPLDQELRAERRRLITTLDSLSDEEFTSGTTLCEKWAPRDILGHLLAVDDPARSYLPFGPFLHTANRAQITRARRLPRETLMDRARVWAEQPSLTSRLGGVVALGDLAVHHQDIVRGLGLVRDLPDAIPTYILWDGALLSAITNLRILRYRVVPTDGYPRLGRPTVTGGAEIHGTREALGLWLAGRDALSEELVFT
jgi:uncharacterized protein (TIGR03083 family)